MKNKLLQLLVMLSKFVFYGITAQIICLGILLASDGISQNIKPISEVDLNVKSENVSIESVFERIESKTDYHFFYDERIIDTKKLVHLKKGKNSISNVLLNISQQAHYKFKQINKVINVNLVENENDKNKVIVEIINQDINFDLTEVQMGMSFYFPELIQWRIAYRISLYHAKLEWFDPFVNDILNFLKSELFYFSE